MAWQDETKELIENLLEDLETPSFVGGSLGTIEEKLKKGLEFNIATIDKIQSHDTRLEDLETSFPIPIKIWEGNWSSGTLTPSTDPGHIVDTGVLADYNILIFVCHQIDGGDEDHGIHWMPQALWTFFNSGDKINRLTVGSDRLKMYFSAEETLAAEAGSEVEILEIWGIK